MDQTDSHDSLSCAGVEKNAVRKAGKIEKILPMFCAGVFVESLLDKR